MPNPSNDEGSRYLHQPAKAARVAMEEYKHRAQVGYGLMWGVPALDEYLIPMVPGDAIGILGRPGHAKTSSLIFLCRSMASQLKVIVQKEQELVPTKRPKVVVYATWETLVEEFVAVYSAARSGQSLETIGRGKANMEKVSQAMAELVRDNIVVVGRSRDTGYLGKVQFAPEVHTLDDLEYCLSWLVQNGFDVGALIVDYLQRIPGKRGMDRTSLVSENVERCKDMAIRYTCPTLIAIQAGRDVDEGGGIRLPGLSSGQHSSNIEQTLDKLFGQSRPILYMAEGQDVLLQGEAKMYKVCYQMLVQKVLKQRWGKAGKTFMLSMEPDLCTMESLVPVGNAPKQSGKDMF